MNSSLLTGKIGEINAQKYLKKMGYKIIQTNYKNKIGEIDIIAQKNKVLCFVEVKTRSSSNFGLPREAVGTFKQNKIRNVATIFLIENKQYENTDIRFDVIDILNDKIELIENAF